MQKTEMLAVMFLFYIIIWFFWWGTSWDLHRCWAAITCCDRQKKKRKKRDISTDHTSKSHSVAFRWHIPSLNRARVVFLSACQTTKACKQGTASPSILAEAVMPPWHGATPQIEDAIAELFLLFQDKLTVLAMFIVLPSDKQWYGLDTENLPCKTKI